MMYFINAWPAVKTASFTYPNEIFAEVPATFTASYTSINSTLPMTYTWNFNGVEVITTDPTYNYAFPEAGDVSVTLTVSSPYDSAFTSETITVIPKPNQAILNVILVPGGGGTVTRDPDQVAYDFGTEVTLTAVPNTGYTFGGWSGGGCSGTGTCIVIMDEDTTVTANFNINTYTLSYSAGANGTLSGDTMQTVNHGASGTAVTANADTGYHFVDWSDGSAENPRIDENVTANISVTANFAINTYTLNYTAGANGSLSGDTTQTVNHGSDGTAVTAIPAAGYHFVDWSDGSFDNPRTDTTVTENISVTAKFAINTYTLTYLAGPNGSLSGITTQTVNHGASGSAVTANADTGYHFVNWSDSSTDNPRTDENVTGDISVTANFAINTYTLQYSAGTGGTLSGDTSQTVDYGVDGTAVEAVPDTGYYFVNWSDGSTDNPRTDENVTGDISVTANFAIYTYTLTYTAGTGGTISGDTSQTVNYGEDGTEVEAVPNTGYHFVNWSDGSTANPRTDENVTENVSVTANFEINTYTLTYTAGTGGTISGDTSQTVIYGEDGTEVEAVPNTGYHFVNWSDSSAENPRTDENVTANISVTANFAINTYTLTYTAGTGGTISGDTSQTVNYGEDGTEVEAVPNTGYHFVNWSDGSTANPRTDENVTENVSVTANFEINTYTLTYTAGTGGTISGDTSQTVIYGEDGTEVEAVPNTGYHFVNWSDSSAENPRTDENVTANISVTANFAINTYTLTYTAGTGGTISGDTSQTVNYGEDGTEVEAVPNTGYHFVNWSDSSTANPRTDENVTANISVTANFAINTYTLQYSAGANGTLSGDTSQTVDYGTSGSPVTANAAAGYHFVDWSDGSAENPRTDENVTGNISVTANFAINTYTLTYLAGPNGSLSGITTQTVNHGASGSPVTANAAAGYHFVDWSDGSAENPRTDENVTANISITANFAINTYTLQYNAGANGSLSGDTTQTVNHGSDGTAVEAVPDTGYYLVEWSDGSTENPRTDENVTGDISVTAIFELVPPDCFTLTVNHSGMGTNPVANPTNSVGCELGTYLAGENILLSGAAPDTGWQISSWTGTINNNSIATTNSVSMPAADHTAGVNYTQITYLLTVVQPIGGSITPETSEYLNGEVVSLTATPDSGYYFVEWTGACSGSGNCSVIMDADKTVSAVFERYKYSLYLPLVIND